MLNLLITPQAELDIDAVITYLLEVNPNAATQFVGELRATFELLADNPQLGTKRHYRNRDLANIRLFPVKKYQTYLIFYLSSDVTLEIIRVLHGRRDLEALFNDSDDSN